MMHVFHVADFRFEFVPVSHFENFVELKIVKLGPVFLRVLYVLPDDIVSENTHCFMTKNTTSGFGLKTGS